MLDAADDARRIALFTAKAHDAGATLIAAGCAADHVHVVLRFAAARALSEVVQRMKGASARAHNLTGATTLAWQDGFWARSCDPDNLLDLIAYVHRQPEHHAACHARERWERDA